MADHPLGCGALRTQPAQPVPVQYDRHEEELCLPMHRGTQTSTCLPSEVLMKKGDRLSEGAQNGFDRIAVHDEERTPPVEQV